MWSPRPSALTPALTASGIVLDAVVEYALQPGRQGAPSFGIIRHLLFGPGTQ
jgi:hypothetical protein